jgi:hypothetical protein
MKGTQTVALKLLGLTQYEEAQRLLSVPFALTRTVRAPESGLRRFRVGRWEGRRTWTFDVVINHRPNHFSEQDGDMIANSYSAAVVELPLRVDGRIGLARRGFLRSPEKLSAPEIEVGTSELLRRFTVNATSHAVAEQVLDERACEWLTGPGRRFHYEIAHNRVLAYGWRRYLGGRGPLRAARGLAAHLALPVVTSSAQSLARQ